MENNFNLIFIINYFISLIMVISLINKDIKKMKYSQFLTYSVCILLFSIIPAISLSIITVVLLMII